MTTDHAYSDHRIALETAVLIWIESVRKTSSEYVTAQFYFPDQASHGRERSSKGGAVEMI